MKPVLTGIFSLLAAAILIQSCHSEEELDYLRYYTTGKALYEKSCQNCHGSRGEGLGALYPPLTDTVYLKNRKHALACIIKHGSTDTVRIAGKTFTGAMPANHHLTDIEVAQLVTYVTNSFGNKQGLYDARAAGADLDSCEAH